MSDDAVEAWSLICASVKARGASQACDLNEVIKNWADENRPNNATLVYALVGYLAFHARDLRARERQALIEAVTLGLSDLINVAREFSKHV